MPAGMLSRESRSLYSYTASPSINYPTPPAPIASEAAPVATTSAQPVDTEKSPAASGRYGLFTRSISMSYSCKWGQRQVGLRVSWLNCAAVQRLDTSTSCGLPLQQHIR